MAMPWTCRIVTIDSDEPYDVTVGAYHLEDLVVEVQELVARTGLFRIEMPEGPETVAIDRWSELLLRDYCGGEPDEPYDMYSLVALRNNAVIVWFP